MSALAAGEGSPLMADTAELVDEFQRQCIRELDQTRANATTSAAVEPRLRAILQTIRDDLPGLRLYPNVAALPDEFDRIEEILGALVGRSEPGADPWAPRSGRHGLCAAHLDYMKISASWSGHHGQRTETRPRPRFQRAATWGDEPLGG